MKRILKLLCLLAVFTLVVVTAFVCAVVLPASPPASLYPIVSVCLEFAAGLAVRSMFPAFIKRFTTATGG